MRTRLLIAGLCSALAGCTSPGALGKSALRHEQHADVLAELGDGEGAARERARAGSLREEARLRTERRTSWFWSDVTLR